MNKNCRSHHFIKSYISFCLVLLLAGLVFPLSSSAFTLHVINGQTNESMADTAFRWMVEVDNTFDTTPGDAVTDQVSFATHNSYAPLAVLSSGTPAKGDGSGGFANVDIDTTGRYYVTVMPNSGYAIGGAQAAAGANDVYVYVALSDPFCAIYSFRIQRPLANQ